MLRALALVFMTIPMLSPVQAQDIAPPAEEAAPDAATPMTLPRLAAILSAIDENATVEPRGITLTVASIPVTVVVDPRANRMRVLVPISSSDALSEEDLMRLMQANFDTALDARYAVAHGRLWSTFIHPLAELQPDQLISGLAQTVTLAQTYGDTYTSGAIMFGGGDTRGLIRQLQELGEEL
ncbi:hypothetical protein [Jannaschia sp. CCS1]|uniref:hypothetical protein n=1 Tax=Jannaschia sp. (strain CCS1) TaxID=290400 RepID=UPI000053CBFA|nr:hypothetical protein [Jannaschia sp. CCS1]ABD53634.1 hypothetical protein Jann_0717 [Jannaschia sp. CCS1]